MNTTTIAIILICISSLSLSCCKLDPKRNNPLHSAACRTICNDVVENRRASIKRHDPDWHVLACKEDCFEVCYGPAGTPDRRSHLSEEDINKCVQADPPNFTKALRKQDGFADGYILCSAPQCVFHANN